MSPSTLWTRYRTSARQFVKFGLIGGAGVLVNMAVAAAANNVGYHVFHSDYYGRFLPLPGTAFSVRNYHVYTVIAFLVANLFNFVLNRHWTFRSSSRAPFLKEYGPFLLTGSLAQGLGLIIITLLMNHESPLYLSWPFLTDGSPFYFKRYYWALALQIALVMPVNFVVNKLWTFRAVRRRHAELSGS